MRKDIPYFLELITIALVAGCTLHPAASAAALLIFLTYRIAEKYLTRNISDQDREIIAQVQSDVLSVKKIQDRAGLSKAFTQQ